MSPDSLPTIVQIRRITQALAMLDAILCPEWEYRYYSFNSKWGPGEEMTSMRNGSGDDWFLLLDSAGAALKGFAHELASDTSFAGAIQKEVPSEFSSFLGEPAFSMDHATFCYWRKTGDTSWSKVASGLTNDGSDEMLACLVSGPSEYKEWAEEYFEVPVSLDAVSTIFAHEPLNEATVRQLNPDADIEQIFADAVEIGYPRNAA